MGSDNLNDSNETPEDDLERANRELVEKYAETIQGWALALKLRDAAEKDPPPNEEK